ncbi:NAD(P)/FAD-dependent oxidoreductase [Actinomadura rugatobispora]|uniref:NAD(P)/FAD-dependent oxidoreductase n=1 Tax=Actinomadura rugatobispora TaxID=1994 RepID=A0ABW1A6A5_9ACTN|nr:FAD-binding oxidoreductase [Actinomadura rugatobispora]
MHLARQDAGAAVIIGGGIIGAAVAYELVRYGLTATLVERDAIGRGQSGRNWGFVRQQGRSPAELPLMRAATRRWGELEEELDASFDWVRGGNLALATDDDGAERYRTWAGIGREHGVDTALIGAAEVQRIVPGLRLPYTAALYAAGDGHADPLSATRAYASAAERGGVRVLCGHTARAIVQRGGRVRGVVTDGGTLDADVVVCAAGSASRRLLRTAGLSLPQNLVRGTVAMTEPVEPLTRASVWAPGLAFRQRPDGRLVVSTGGGGEVDLTLETMIQARRFLPAFRHNARRLRLRVNGAALHDLRRRFGAELPDPEPRPTYGRVRDSMLRLREAVPALSSVRCERAWAGQIDSTPDALPVVDRLPDPAGLVVATGFSGHGFGLAPAIAESVADLVVGAPPRHETGTFRFSRFAEGDFKAPDAIL